LHVIPPRFDDSLFLRDLAAMSERGVFRGRGGGRGGDRGGRGGGGGGGGGRGAHGGGAAGGQAERPKKENILDLNKYMDKQITVKFSGGREGACASIGHGTCGIDCGQLSAH